jgi:hypothetical protein
MLTVTDTVGQTRSAWHYVEIVDNGGTPPTDPGNFTATATSPTTVALSWTASTGGMGTITYVIQRRTSMSSPWGPQSSTTSTSYVDTQVSYGVLFEYRIRAVDAAGQWSDWISNFAMTVIFGPDVQRYVTVIDGDHVRDLRDAVDAWRSYAGLAQVYPANPVPVGDIKAANFVTNFASDPLPGVVTALDQAFGAMGWPGMLFFGVPAPAPGVPVYVEHVNQLREVMTWW